MQLDLLQKKHNLIDNIWYTQFVGIMHQPAVPSWKAVIPVLKPTDFSGRVCTFAQDISGLKTAASSRCSCISASEISVRVTLAKYASSRIKSSIRGSSTRPLPPASVPTHAHFFPIGLHPPFDR